LIRHARRALGKHSGAKRDESHAMAQLTHLQRLEAESIDILREAVAESEHPVLLY
jgi:sulfate adenylyltransferase subunit 2